MRLKALLVALLIALTPSLADAAQNTKWYVDSVAWTAVTAWASNTAKSAGNLIRQNAAPAVGNERVFAELAASCTTTNGAEPTWTVSRGAKTTDNTCTWIEVTGQPGVNGDTTNSPTWLTNKNGAVSQGLIIYDSVSASLQIVTTAGTEGNGAQPSFSATAGNTTADNTVTWTSLGAASNFTAFEAPFDRMETADALSGAATAGDTIFVASEHAQSSSTVGIGTNGTQGLPILYISTTKAVPPVYSAGASVTATGTISLPANGTGTVFDGVNFTSSTTSSPINVGTISGGYTKIENSTLSLTGAGASTLTLGNNSNAYVRLENVTVNTQNAGDLIQLGGSPGGYIEWAGGSVTGTVPSVLFYSNDGPRMWVHGVDMSLVTGNLFTAGQPIDAEYIFSDSKIGAGVTISRGPFSRPVGEISLINVDSGATGYRNEWHNFYGDITTSTTTVRTGGATDGVQAVSHQYVSSANTALSAPMIGPRICQWSTFTSGSHTATIEVAGAQSLNNNDMWLEIEYLGSALSPASSFVNTGLANPLSTASALTTSSASWTGSPANTQKMTATFTPAMQGLVCGRVMFAKPSTTENVDPVLTINFLTPAELLDLRPANDNSAEFRDVA